VGIPENLQERRAAIEKAKLEDPIPDDVKDKVKDLLAAHESNPDDIETGIQIASIYRKAELYDEANKILGPILDSNPNSQPARREQARVWCDSGELSISVNLFEELLVDHPHDQALKMNFLTAKIKLLNQESTRWKNRSRVHQFTRKTSNRTR
jgi:tetratricopeptide (TPR) repeat protein